MENAEFNKAISTLGQKVVLIEKRAHEVSASLEALSTKAELLKIDILKWELERKTKSLARQTGYRSMSNDSGKLGFGLMASAAGVVVGGVLNKDGLSALAGGIAGFDGAALGFGSSKWAVSLDRDLIVAPHDGIAPKRTWVTMESLVIALGELKEKARGGEQCGNLESMIERLKRGHSKLVRLVPASQWVAVRQNGSTSA